MGVKMKEKEFWDPKIYSKIRGIMVQKPHSLEACMNTNSHFLSTSSCDGLIVTK